VYECPRAVPEDPQYEENLPRLPLYAGLGVRGRPGRPMRNSQAGAREEHHHAELERDRTR